MTVKFATVMGNSTLASKPFYVGIPQHERTMTKKETYAYCAERTGYKPTQVRAVFMALRQYLKENANRGNVTYIDGVASIRHYVKGAFEGLGGPWVKGKNYLLVQAVEMDPFKSLLGDIIPANGSRARPPTAARRLPRKPARKTARQRGTGHHARFPLCPTFTVEIYCNMSPSMKSDWIRQAGIKRGLSPPGSSPPGS